MPKYFTGTYTTTQNLTNPGTDNPATVTSTGLISVNSTSAYASALFGNSGFAWTLTNLGTVESLGNQGFGINLQSGGSITNGQSGSTAGRISGVRSAINIVGGAGTVTNFGTISASQTVSGGGFGIFLGAGGTITNLGTVSVPFANNGAAINIGAAGGRIVNGQAGSALGLITAYHTGIGFFPGTVASPGTVTVVNYGMIQSTQPDTAAATGFTGWAINLGTNGRGTIDNFGTISGVETGGGGAILMNAGGVVVNGATDATGALITAATTGLQVNGSAGTITNFGTIASTTTGTVGGAVALSAGGTVTNYGLITSARAPRVIGTAIGFGAVITTSTISATIQNFGTITTFGSNESQGINLLHGGLIVNGAASDTSALITASRNVIYAGGHLLPSGAAYSYPGATTTVVNYGTIQSTGAGQGVLIVSGGMVTNFGTIEAAASTGVSFRNTAGTVSNFGTILSNGTTAGVGVYLGYGGIITNAVGASIAAVRPAISGRGAPATVVNSGLIQNSGAYSAIYLRDGGVVTNTASGTIASPVTGVAFNNTSGTAVSVGSVVNFGTILSTGVTFGAGVSLSHGGALTNQDTGLISAYRTGVVVRVAAGTVANYGTIESTGTAYSGVYLFAGGGITNGASGSTGALITGGNQAIGVSGGTGTIVNYGSITATGTNSYGINLSAGGSVTNGASGSGDGLIQGYFRGVSIYSTSGTVTNYGTIAGTGTSSDGVRLTSGGRMTNGPSGLVIGRYGVRITGTGGTVSNLGTIRGTATYGAGVGMHQAGSVNNGASGLITGSHTGIAIAGGIVTNGVSGSGGGLVQGYSRGVDIFSTSGTVINYGTLAGTGTGGTAVYLHDGGTVANAGTIAATATSGAGVVLLGGGIIGNSASGVISGGHVGVNFNGGAGTLVNLGTIAATDTAGYPIGVVLQTGGSVINGQPGAPAASITAARYAVWVLNAPGTIANYGTIAATGPGSRGVFLEQGGAVVNGASGSAAASISGAAFGVSLHNAVGTVTNHGTIAGTGTASTAVYLTDSGAVTNQESGLITGGRWGVRISGVGTVVNLGSIVASDGLYGLGVVISLGGNVINGATDATNALISGVRIYHGAGPSTVTNFATINAAGIVSNGVSLEDGAVINQQSGVIEGRNGLRIGGSGTLANLGTIAGTSYGAIIGDGSVTNAASGRITGRDGVRIPGTGGSVGNLGTIMGTAVYGSGVNLAADGSVTNGASGATTALISGVSRGVQLSGGGSPGTVINFATIAGTDSAGVYIGGGGAVTNYESGLIEGSHGVYIGGGAGTLDNLGTIAGTAGVGAGLHSGSVSNGTSEATDASIAGAYGGVSIDNGAGAVTNFGTITASVSFAGAVKLQAGGLVTNEESGLIRGGSHGIRIDGGAGTVNNLGTVAGVSDTGIGLISGGTVANGTSGPGSAAITGGEKGIFLFAGGLVINGHLGSDAASISGGTYGVEARYAGATVINYGTIAGISQTAVFLDHGGTVTNAAGALVASTHTGISIRNAVGTLDNSGTVQGDHVGVDFSADGTVTNRQSGVIGSGIGIAMGGVGTVANLGTITGTYTNFGPGVLLHGGSVSNGAGTVTDASIAGSHRGVLVYSSAGTITNFGTITASYTQGTAVDLQAGGAVDNEASGLLRGGGHGIRIDGSAGTVTNLGTVVGIGDRGVVLGAGGTVANGTSIAGAASITGYSIGVAVFSLPGNIVNFGTIAGTGTGSTGVYLQNGGTVVNGHSGSTAAVISGGRYGVWAENGPGTVINYGTIAATDPGSTAIFLNQGGYVGNRQGALVEGVGEGVCMMGSAGTLVNFGTVAAIGTGGSGAVFENGSVAFVANYGPIAGSHTGVGLDFGGSITNHVSGLITGGYSAIGIGGGAAGVVNSGTIAGGSHGIQAFGGSDTVTNLGRIAGTTGAGVYLIDGGLLVNGQSGSTAGEVVGAIGVRLGGVGSVVNYGSIISTAADQSGIILHAGGSVANFGTILGTVGSNGIGVAFNGVGTVQNGASGSTAGLILGSYAGVSIGNSGGTVVNFGSIASLATSRSGVFLDGGGTVANYGTITGGPAGAPAIYIRGELSVTNAAGGSIEGGVSGRDGGTVANSGTIAGADRGVGLGAGGSVTNGLSGLITGRYGVRIDGTAGSVANLGTISGTGSSGEGIVLKRGGTIVNGSSADTVARITGSVAAVGIYYGSTAAEIRNYGTISGTGSSSLVWGFSFRLWLVPRSSTDRAAI